METSAPALAAQELDKELKSVPTIPPEAPINDLTMVVKKKKKVAPAESSTAKRKAEDEPLGSPGEKKAKLEGES